MRTIFIVAVLALAALGAGTIIGSCMSPEAKAAHDAVLQKYEQINADGIVTEAEANELRELVTAYYKLAADDLGGFEWETLAGTALASVLFSVTGVNFMRNRSLPGTVRKPPG